MAAPGPYICAETQGGGFPMWLLAKKDVRIRHSSSTFFKKYDQNFSKYCLQWYANILPILKKHQITEKKNGCVIALQIENEMFEQLFKYLPIGLSDEMRHLCEAARNFRMTVPFFTNDAFEEGSFNPKSSKFGIDLYGFDKYVIFVPISSPLGALLGDSTKQTAGRIEFADWEPKTFSAAVDIMEKKVRSFKGGAAESPIFIPELQGGWFNHYTVPYTYDDIYNFYGDNYTNTLVNSVIAQGSTMFSIYMFYGGTNWGTLGDPDVYTSYDYSACIREFGYLSGKARRLRLAFCFIKSFSNLISQTDLVVGNAEKDWTLSVSPPQILNRIRKTAMSNNATEFVFLRNFSSEKRSKVNFTLKFATKSIKMNCNLPYKQSFIALCNYAFCDNRFHLLLNTAPIHMRIKQDDNTEIWMIQNDEECSGEFAFRGEVKVEGSLKAEIRNFHISDDNYSIVAFNKGAGWASLSNGVDSAKLLIFSLNSEDLLTFYAKFEESWFSKTKITQPHSAFTNPTFCCWGVDGAKLYDGKLSIEATKDQQYIFSLNNSCPQGFQEIDKLGEVEDDNITKYLGAPYLYIYSLVKETSPKQFFEFKRPALTNWHFRHTSFQSLPWVPLKNLASTNYEFKPSMDPLDFGFTSGHVLYKFTFDINNKATTIEFNISYRHRATIYLNGEAVGGSLTYSLQLFQPGTKVGPEWNFGGWKRFTLPKNILNETNELVIITESFGLNRQAFIFNDCRNPRGILGLKFSKGSLKNLKSFISGVDIKNVIDSFSSSGFPDENISQWNIVDTVKNKSTAIELELKCNQLPTWFKGDFQYTRTHLHIPLRLQMGGRGTAYIWVNGFLIARYYGNGDSPQKNFYIMHGILLEGTNEVKLLCYDGRVENKDNSNENIFVEIKEWKVNDSKVNLNDRWSGNIEENGKSYVVFRKDLKL
ncbi:hypothetical protein HK099_000406 [Clydaea vesicula]|uniref:Beta-galactosidase n=1 Tax=Clydaea vesicula TaxID=447962 RepID=A0AAD5TXA4_9FUNG|nr:hypothetical protein HK099_000406 [Clydaea vesicula]